MEGGREGVNEGGRREWEGGSESCLYMHLFLCVCLPVYLSVCLSVSLPVCLSTYV